MSPDNVLCIMGAKDKNSEVLSLKRQEIIQIPLITKNNMQAPPCPLVGEKLMKHSVSSYFVLKYMLLFIKRDGSGEISALARGTMLTMTQIGPSVCVRHRRLSDTMVPL
jgi:hypothetical protein